MMAEVNISTSTKFETTLKSSSYPKISSSKKPLEPIV
jgi:hypothetical protein